MPKQRRNQINRQLKRETRERKAQSRFIESPTPKKARHIAGAEARKEYTPVLRGLKSEVAGSNKREGELKDWYGGLTAQNQAAQQSAATSSGLAESALTQRLANASASDSSALQAQASQNADLAKLLGGPTNSAGQAEAAKGAQAVAQQRVALTSPLSAERASYQNYLGQRGISATERGIEAHKAETSRRRKIKEDLRAGKKERGQAVVANLEKLREGARDYVIQKQAFGQKTKESALGAREAAKDRRLKAREGAAGRSIDEAKLGISEAQLKNETRKTNQAGRKVKREAREAKHGGGLTPTQRRNQKESNQDAAAAVGRTIQANGVPKTPQEWAGLEAIVAKESGVGSRRASEAVRRYKQRTAPERKKKAVLKGIATGF
jgi:hypothetical protein